MHRILLYNWTRIWIKLGGKSFNCMNEIPDKPGVLFLDDFITFVTSKLEKGRINGWLLGSKEWSIISLCLNLSLFSLNQFLILFTFSSPAGVISLFLNTLLHAQFRVFLLYGPGLFATCAHSVFVGYEVFSLLPARFYSHTLGAQHLVQRSRRVYKRMVGRGAAGLRFVLRNKAPTSSSCLDAAREAK